MKDLMFLLPQIGYDQEIIIQAEYVESIMLPALEHEAGHIAAAYHYGARLLGIGVGFMPERNQQGMFMVALYQSEDWTIETHCVVKAAGPAADVLFFGGFSEKGASGDLADIEGLTGKASLDPYLGVAKEILATYAEQIKCIAAALRERLENVEERRLGTLPGGRIGALILDESQLMQCVASK
jgi:hypothetical protein